MDPQLLSSVITLLLIASLVALFARWIHVPHTIALVLVGLVIALTKLMPGVYLTHDLIFTLILPPLLFYGALHVDLGYLLDNWRSIALLAIPGVLCSTFVIGFLLNKVWGIEMMYALLFGALITPTDPISVLAILKNVNAPKRLRFILEGESLFNDGTGVVVFSVILAMIQSGGDFHLGGAVVKFFKVALGGTLVGLVCGGVVYKIMKRIDERLIEISLTIVLAFGTPLLAEAFHFSGIIAVVIAGMTVGNIGKICSVPKLTRDTLRIFWEVIDFTVTSLIFLLIGVELQVISKGDFLQFHQPILWGILIVLVSRLIVVYPMIALANKFNSVKIPGKWDHVLFWGGLKGAIPMALILGLPKGMPYRNLFLTSAFSIVLFSLVVQGLTVKFLVKKLKLAEDPA